MMFRRLKNELNFTERAQKVDEEAGKALNNQIQRCCKSLLLTI